MLFQGNFYLFQVNKEYFNSVGNLHSSNNKPNVTVEKLTANSVILKV